MAGCRHKGKSAAASSVIRRRLKIKKWNVVPAAGQARYKRSTGGFFPDDMVNEILLRLPSGPCIVRFRCVCKSWNRLLSHPRFIHNILFSPDVHSAGNDETAQVLIAGDADDNPGDASPHYVYTLLHYNNLKTITPIDKDPDLPCVPDKVRYFTTSDGYPIYFELTCSIVVGCCDGIVCIADKLYSTASDIILWNPATSETRVLPRSPFSGHRTDLYGRLFVELLGFGFDSEANDYKIVRSINAPFDDNERPARESWSLVEVYSLKNDSWRKVDGQFSPSESNPVRHPYWYRGETLYWWKSDLEGTQLASWDMGKEAFDEISFPNPTGNYKWIGDSFTLLKDSIVGVFTDLWGGSFKPRSFEIRVLLKFDSAVPWTLLYSFPELVNGSCFSGIWKGGMYFVHQDDYRGNDLFTFDPETSHVGELGTLDKFRPEIVAFVPSHVSLSGFKVEDGDDSSVRR